MAKTIDPKSLGLSARTVVEAIDQNILAIVINRKSRIIMADGRKILDKSATIKEAKPGCQIMLKTTAPVCSKTLKFLADQGIKVIRD
jgi:hypothetical protein